ncbi:MAG: hypothetical protein NXI32_02460 [bacterium]|nr:hypothetical protein [bacterium]
MSTASVSDSAESASKDEQLKRKAKGTTSLRAQKVDVVASMLMAGLVVIGLLVLLLFFVWLTQTFTWKAGEIKIEQERVAGRGDHAEGFERDIEPPGMEEILDLTEPTLAETLEAVTESASSVAASVEAIDSNSVTTTGGSGRGDSRPPGPLGEGDDIIPRYERWELKFQAKGLRPYASQLGYYQIELGCVGGGIATVDYAFNLDKGPQTRSGSSADENKQARLFFMWRQENQLMQFDRQLLSEAGVQTQGRQILKFIPKDLEQKLYEIEMKHAQSQGHDSVKEIAKTIFESRATPTGGYEFVVIEQRYRIPRS